MSDCTAALRSSMPSALRAPLAQLAEDLRGLGRFLRKLLAALALHERPPCGGRSPAARCACLGGAPAGLRPPPSGAATRAGNQLSALARTGLGLALGHPLLRRGETWLPAPYSGPGARASPPTSFCPTCRLRLRLVGQNLSTPPPGCRLDRGLRPPPHRLRADHYASLRARRRGPLRWRPRRPCGPAKPSLSACTVPLGYLFVRQQSAPSASAILTFLMQYVANLNLSSFKNCRDLWQCPGGGTPSASRDCVVMVCV